MSVLKIIPSQSGMTRMVASAVTSAKAETIPRARNTVGQATMPR